MRKTAIVVAIMLATGCATAPATKPGAACDASRAQGVVGQPQGDAVAERARRAAGAGTVRWLRPGQMVTMEFRADRLNLDLDEAGVITGVRCG